MYAQNENLTWQQDIADKLRKRFFGISILDAGLLADDEDIHTFCPHSVGHSLGLDPHDTSVKDFELKEGMVITIEPGLYFKDKGFGVRIEDDVLVERNGCTVLSREIIKEFYEIENIMKN